MKITEIINENAVGTLQTDIADALPDTTVLTDFKNTDPYEQYRLGLAIAGARAKAAGDIADFNAESAWGENMVVTAYTPEEQQTLDLALKLIPNKSAHHSISTAKSEEATDVSKQSPMQPRGPIALVKK